MKIKAVVPNVTLTTNKQAYNANMAVQWKHERIKRAKGLGYKMKLSAMLTSDNRAGKVWS